MAYLTAFIRKIRLNRGQALVEFVLVLPLLLLFLLGIVQMGLLLNGFITIQKSARLGVREASLGENASAVGCSVYTQISGTGLFPNTAVVNWTLSSAPTTAQSSPTVTLTVGTNYPLIVGIPGFGNFVPLSQTYIMPQETQTTNPSSTNSGSFTVSKPPSSCP
jgi:Flp pilus assembly protein TadG